MREPEQVKNAARELRTLCESGAAEETLHVFLREHFYLFYNAIGFLDNPSNVYSKVPLGNRYQTDFATYFDKTSGRYWLLVELERADVPLFTRRGDPTTYLTHAVRQVQDWQAWVADNVQFARTFLTDVLEPIGVVVIGRRDTLTAENRRHLRELLRQNRNLEIMTYDRLLDGAAMTADANSWLDVAVYDGKTLLANPPPAQPKYRQDDSDRRSHASSTTRANLIQGEGGKLYIANPRDEFHPDGWIHPLASEPDDSK